MIAIRDLSEAQIEQILDKTGISPFKGGYVHYNFEEPERYIWSIDKEIIGKDEFYVVLDIFHRLESLRSQINIDKVETQTEHQEAMSAFSGEAEWKNGDECLSSTGYLFTFIGLCNTNGFDCILLSKDGVPTFGFTKELSKPETPQQREDRERLESAYDLYCHTTKSRGDMPYGLEYFIDTSKTGYLVDYLAIVDKTKYKKGGEL